MKVDVSQLNTQKGSFLFIAAFLVVAAGFFYAFTIDTTITLYLLLLSFAFLIFTLFPKIAILFMAFLIPVIGWEFNIGRFDFLFIDFLSIIILAAFYTRALYSYLFKSRTEVILKFPLFLPFLIFLTSIFISSLMSPDIIGSAWYAIRVVLFFYLAYVSIPYSIITDFNILKQTIIFLVLMGIIIGVAGVGTLFYQYIANDFFRIQNIQIFSIYPFGSNHNLIAEFLVVTNFFLLALQYWATSEKTRRILNLLFILLSITLLLTLSRSGWIVFGIQIFIYLWLRRAKMINILAGACIGALLFLPLILKMEQLQTQNFSSDASRLLITQIAWESFLEKPWFGQGTGNFLDLIGQSIRYTAKYGEPFDAHGVWPKLLAENGLFGVLSFAALSFLIFRILFKAIKKYPDYLDLLLPLTVGAFGGYIYQFLNTSYYKGKVWLPIAVALAAVHLIELKKKDVSTTH